MPHVRLLIAAAATVVACSPASSASQAPAAVHAWVNFDAAPLDRDVAAIWSTLPPSQQLFLAATGGVGPAPTLAPGALGEVALAVALGTIGHPALVLTRHAAAAADSAMRL